MTFHWARVWATGICIAALCAASTSRAADDVWQGVNLGNWNNIANWDQGTFPLRDSQHVAVINNSTTAVVNSNQTGANGPAGIVLGTAAANVGGITIQTGGSLSSQPSGFGFPGTATVGLAGTGTVTLTGGSFLPQSLVLGQAGAGIGTVTVQNGGTVTVTEELQVGQLGRGTLNVLGGGTVTAARLNSGGTTGATASLIALGDASGLTATVTSNGPTSLLRTTQVTGPNVNFTSTGPLTLPGTHTLIADIRNAANHSALKSASSASVAGTLRLQFNGVTPALGNAWSLVNATSISGTFGTIDSTAAPALPAGQSYQTRRIAGGNGQLLQVAVEQLLTLQVHRQTGAVTIRNSGAAVAAADVSIDSYSVTSANGGLNGANVIWNSLNDQAVPGWQEITPVATNLTEINAGTPTLIAGGQTRALGTPYTPMYPAFRAESDDVTFQYSTPGGTRTGLIEYLGNKVANNLVVSINPTTGVATLKNDSNFNVSIEGYSIFSTSGALRPANGQWNSLTDQGTANWTEAAPTANVLSELAISGSLPVPAQSTRNLGALFNPAGMQDLTFEFLLAGDPDSVPGVVQFGSSSFQSADFNQDGTVNGADLTIWRNSFGVNAGANTDGDGDSDGIDFLTWQQQRVAGATAAAAAVPEPATWLLSVLAGALVCRQTRRRRDDAVNFATRTWSTRMQSVQARKALVGLLVGVAAWCAAIGSGKQAQGADILLVARPAQFGASDQELITLLKGFGHTILNEAAVAANNAAFTGAVPTAAQLTNVDVIVFSRNNNSGDFTNGTGAASEAVMWNTINKPLIAMSPAIIRGTVAGTANGNARWGLVNSAANVDNMPAPTNLDAFPNAAHPFVAGRTTSIFPPSQTIDYVNFTANEVPTGATVVATMTEAFNTFPSIVDIPAGTTLFGDINGVASVAGGRRVIFQMSEYNDANDVFALSTNGGQILNQIVTQLGGAASTRAGDVDGDGDVDQADLDVIKTNFRTAVAHRGLGDLTGDGTVDINDFRVWKENDPLAGVGASIGVPEPSSFALAALGLAAAMTRRRRKG